MDLRQWKVPKDESQLVPESALQRFHDGIGGAAVRTLVVTVLH
jgi:hypothetical protein